MNYSKKLRKVIERIKEIMIEEDVAGVVTLHEDGFCEYLLHLTTTHSLARVNQQGAIEFTMKKHFLSDSDKILAIRHTSNMLRLLAEGNKECALTLLRMSDYVDESCGATHSKIEYSNL